jgi:8-oxo-dGTP pyrophosphatase MutT (NUDIX family)
MTTGLEAPREDEPVARECVEGYLYCRDPLRLLILRRPPSRGSIWVPVSGKVDPGDATLEAALRRELFEETGLTTPVRVESLDWEVPFRAENGEVWRLHAYGVEVASEFEVRLSDEHVAAEWLGPGDATARLHYPDNREAIERLLQRISGSRNP